MKSILVPVDFSKSTDKVIQSATELARALNGQIILLHVTQTPVNFSGRDPLLLENAARITDTAEKAADKHLDQLRNAARSDYEAIESLRLAGNPVAQILAQANYLSADYVVMGSHGHTAVYNLLVGSTAHGVLKKASCPVLIVPPEGKPTS